jgi:hypothetical protein
LNQHFVPHYSKWETQTERGSHGVYASLIPVLNFEYTVAGIVNSIAWPKCLWSNGAPSRSHLDRAIKFKALFRCDDGHNAKLSHRGEAVVQADFLNDFAVDNLENCRTSEAHLAAACGR